MLAKAVEELTAAYQKADAVLQSGLEEKVKAGDDELAKKLDALQKNVDTAKTELQAAVDKVQSNLDQAVTDLNKKIAEGDAANAEELQKQVAALTEAYTTADYVLK